MDKKHCVGCRENFYNGNNDIGEEECWMLKDAKLVRRWRIPIDMPMYRENFDEVTVPNCYHDSGYMFRDDITGCMFRPRSVK